MNTESSFTKHYVFLHEDFCNDRQSLKGLKLGRHKNKTIRKNPTVFKPENFMIFFSYKSKLVKYVGFVYALNRRANELECCEVHCRAMDKCFEKLLKKKKKKKLLENTLVKFHGSGEICDKSSSVDRLEIVPG